MLRLLGGGRNLVRLTANSQAFVTRPVPTPLAAFATRHFSNPTPKKGFINNLIDNLKDEMEKNKELQDHQKQLKQRMQELNESDALKDARKKFELVEKETLKNSQVVRQKIEELSEQISRMVKEIEKTEAGKKLSEAGKEALKQARAAAENVEKMAEKVGDTEVYKQVSSSMKNVKDEIDTIADVRMYSRPESLKKRTDGYAEMKRTFEPNEEATEMQLHKESRWYSSWKKFSEENVYYNKVLDWKIRYDESDNLAVRFVRGITDKMTNLFAGQNEVSNVLTEIAKIDPSFDKVEFLRFVEKEVIPNVLEAFIRSDVDVLKDWCHERAFSILSQVIKDYGKMHYSMGDSRIIDISKVEMVTGKMMEQGPVIIITFQAFMLNVVKNSEGKIVEGNADKPVRVHHVWVLCRDMEEYNPALAWKVLELHMQEGNLAL
ncbi:hypothetical protein WR25_16112 [Diploscapter pachys]|uniref:Mitochondrial import inner membrane translocase subunit TIM44 n=1 Tax=Diploscapter pachys TaxID=2018661 RepID=A0A2A2LB52_9BILA|nr:hypothetical protein WR25_16112 [Diploscapter pachys]